MERVGGSAYHSNTPVGENPVVMHVVTSDKVETLVPARLAVVLWRT
jgi:hypothetical protein